MKEVIEFPARYRIISPLGQGGMGNVYKVFDSVVERELALKLLTSSNEISKELLMNEFEILSKLNHQNLVRVYNLGFTVGDIPFFTMDLVDGVNIQTFFNEPHNDSYFHFILRSIFSALIHLHERNIFHGDIKPANILISIDPTFGVHVTLLDFGLAINRPTPGRNISGTLAYIAPELFSRGEHTPSSDLYSLGMTLLSSMTGIDIPIPGTINNEFYRHAYTLLNKRLSSTGVASPSTTASLLISLCAIDPYIRPVNAEICLKALPSFLPNRKKYFFHFENIFANRNKELAMLDDFLDSIDSEKNTILLIGPAGIGKKCLISKSMVTAQLRNFLTVDFSSPRYNTNSLDRFIELLGDNLTEECKNNLIRSHTEIIKSLGSASTIDSSTVTNNRSNILYDNIVQYIHNLSYSRPILVCIPDIQRFNIDFLHFIHHFVYESDLLHSRIRILLSADTTIKSKEISSYIDNLISLTNVTELELKPFSIHDTSTFIAESFGDKLFTEHQTTIIQKVSGGVPLYLSRLFQHYISLDILQWDGNEWNLDHNLFDKFKAPDTLGEMIYGSYNSLSQRKKVILQTLSLFREPVQVNDFISFLSSKDDPLHSIEDLINDNLVYIDNGFLDFSNPMYRQIILKKLSPIKRSKLNSKIADFLMRHYPDNIIEITHYLLGAKYSEECIIYGTNALSILCDKRQYHSAFELSSSLYDLVKSFGSQSQQIQILKLLAHVEVMIGEVTKAAIHYNILYNNSNDPAEKSLFLKNTGRIKEYFLSDREGAHKDYDRALIIARDSSNIELMAEIMALQGYSLKRNNSIELLEESARLSKGNNSDLYTQAISIIIYVYQLTGKIEQMHRYINELKSLLATHNLSDVTKGRAFHVLYLTSFYQGDYTTARYYLNEMVNLSNVTKNELENISNLKALGGLSFIEGQYTQMIETLIEALSIAKRFSDTSSIILILENLSGAYKVFADYGKALDALDQANSLIIKSKTHNINLTIYLKPLSLYIQLGDHFSSKIEHYSRKLREKAQRNSDQIMLGHRQLALSRYHYQKLAFRQGITCALKALSHFSSSNDRDDIVDSLSHLAVYETEKGVLDNATGHVKEARAIFDEIHCEYLRPYLLLAEGAVALAKGDAAAEGILENALATSKKMGTREITWQIQRQLALLFLDSDDIQTSAAFYRDAMESIKQITESIPDDEIKMSYLSLPFRKRVFDEIKTIRSK